MFGGRPFNRDRIPWNRRRASCGDRWSTKAFVVVTDPNGRFPFSGTFDGRRPSTQTKSGYAPSGTRIDPLYATEFDVVITLDLNTVSGPHRQLRNHLHIGPLVRAT